MPHGKGAMHGLVVAEPTAGLKSRILVHVPGHGTIDAYAADAKPSRRKIKIDPNSEDLPKKGTWINVQGAKSKQRWANR